VVGTLLRVIRVLGQVEFSLLELIELSVIEILILEELFIGLFLCNLTVNLILTAHAKIFLSIALGRG
jgi:predicted nucleic acid-binding OB-fold protein